MRDRRPTAPARDRAGAEERSLRPIGFVGSYPTTDFRLAPPLPELAIVGRSNVGKSSLLNALTGRKAIARTSQTPGKTQACNVYRVEDTCYLVDLPGYGYARASKQARAGFQKLIRSCLTDRPELTGVLWLLDIRHDPSVEDRAMAELLADRGVPVLVALTKADKVARSKRGDRLRTLAGQVGVAPDQCVVTSVKAREGVPLLRDAVASLMDRAAGRRRTG